MREEEEAEADRKGEAKIENPSQVEKCVTQIYSGGRTSECSGIQ